ncbi:MAG: hypothetical protein ACTSRU_09025 [Candidatus Hodarchaeales archaeon]
MKINKIDRYLVLICVGVMLALIFRMFVDLVMGTYVHFFNGEAWWTRDQVNILQAWFIIIIVTPINCYMLKKWEMNDAQNKTEDEES